MSFRPPTRLCTLLVLFVLAGCSSTAQVRVQERFPTVVAEPRDLRAALVITQPFGRYVAQPTSNISIEIGSAQVELLENAFQGLFREVEVVSSRQQVDSGVHLVIVPSVSEVQISTPSDNYLNVYEVWIKYNLDIETGAGDPIDSWFMPAYGKTPDSFMLSRSEAIEAATVMALRDAGAKLLLDFYRIPAVAGWVRDLQQQRGQ